MVRIGDAQSQCAPHHELVARSGVWPLKAKPPQTPDQRPARDGAEGRHLRDLPDSEADTADLRYGQIARQAQHNPLFKHLC